MELLNSGLGPGETKSVDHPQTHQKGSTVVGVAAFAHSHPGVKRDRTFDYSFSAGESRVQEMSVKPQLIAGFNRGISHLRSSDAPPYRWFRHR